MGVGVVPSMGAAQKKRCTHLRGQKSFRQYRLCLGRMEGHGQERDVVGSQSYHVVFEGASNKVMGCDLSGRHMLVMQKVL